MRTLVVIACTLALVTACDREVATDAGPDGSRPDSGPPPDSGPRPDGGPDAGLECVVASDCPDAENACVTVDCVGGSCVTTNVAAGTPLDGQTAADCRVLQCDGDGNLESVPDDEDFVDLPDDCVVSGCNAGTPTEDPIDAGEACGSDGSNVCDGSGMCVGCVTADTCPGEDGECGVRTCTDGVCGRNDRPAGERIAGQIVGDCQVVQCDGSGGTETIVDDTDSGDVADDCFVDTCSEGTHSRAMRDAGSSCAAGVCTDTGMCVGCLVPEDCPGSDDECSQRTCVENVCGRANTDAGFALAEQVEGDCRVRECDGTGGVRVSNLDTDVPVDGDECTLDVCTDGTPSNPPAPATTTCGDGLTCDGSGSCVGCTSPSQCPGTDSECGARTCDTLVCGFAASDVLTACTGGLCDGLGSCVATADSGAFAVLRVGSGATLGSAAAPVFVERYGADGTAVDTLALPTTPSGDHAAFVLPGTSTTFGAMARSADARYLVAGGYDAAVGTTSLGSSSPADVNRIVARIDAAGAVDTTTRITNAYTGSGGAFRSATSDDGTAFWLGGTGTQGGVQYTTFGTTAASTLITLAGDNVRVVHVYEGQLYGGSGSAALAPVFQIGTGLPTTSGQSRDILPGLSDTGDPCGFLLVDVDPSVPGVDTLYIADATGGGGGIQKWTFADGTWTRSATTFTGTTPFRGLTGLVLGEVVVLYATTAEPAAQPSRVVRFVDHPSMSVAEVTLATAAAGTRYRSVALAPR